MSMNYEEIQRDRLVELFVKGTPLIWLVTGESLRVENEVMRSALMAGKLPIHFSTEEGFKLPLDNIRTFLFGSSPPDSRWRDFQQTYSDVYDRWANLYLAVDWSRVIRNMDKNTNSMADSDLAIAGVNLVSALRYILYSPMDSGFHRDMEQLMSFINEAYGVNLSQPVLYVDNMDAILATQDSPELFDLIKRAVRVLPAMGINLVTDSASDETIPNKYRHYFYIAQWQLPTKQQLTVTLKSIIKAEVEDRKEYIRSEYTRAGKDPRKALQYLDKLAKGFLGNAELIDEIVENAKGMMAFNFEEAVYDLVVNRGLEWLLSAGTKQSVRKEVSLYIWKAKSSYIAGVRGLEVYKPTDQDSFDMIGGLEELKRFLVATASQPHSKGVLFIGVPGTGKSAIAKALGHELGVPVLTLNLGQVFSSLVGASEANLMQMLQIVKRMEPCVLIVDEIDKQFAGLQSSHASDAGTTARVISNLLTWLNDRTERIYVVGTCNSLTTLPSAMVRGERWDSIYLFLFPTEKERQAIWNIWRQYYKIPEEAVKPANDEGWTGANIRQCCRIASMMLASGMSKPEECLIDASKHVNRTSIRRFETTEAGDIIQMIRDGEVIPVSEEQVELYMKLRKRVQAGEDMRNTSSPISATQELSELTKRRRTIKKANNKGGQ